MNDTERELMAEIEADARAAVAEGIESAVELASYLNAAGPAGPVWFGEGTPGEWATDHDELAVYTVRPCDPAHLDALLGYIWRGPMSGEFDNGYWHEVIPGHLYVFELDTTKSQRDDVIDVWDSVKGLLVEGTPVRKTDRSGPGTKGTRAHEGLGPVLLAWR
jgi:hypothetical protein